MVVTSPGICATLTCSTLVRVLEHLGDDAKAIVWALISHVVDARATSMGWSRGELNIGQLCKEADADQALDIGCGTYTGTVATGRRWDADMQIMKINPRLPNSYEDLTHATDIKNFGLDLRQGKCGGKL